MGNDGRSQVAILHQAHYLLSLPQVKSWKTMSSMKKGKGHKAACIIRAIAQMLEENPGSGLKPGIKSFDLVKPNKAQQRLSNASQFRG